MTDSIDYLSKATTLSLEGCKERFDEPTKTVRQIWKQFQMPAKAWNKRRLDFTPPSWKAWKHSKLSLFQGVSRFLVFPRQPRPAVLRSCRYYERGAVIRHVESYAIRRNWQCETYERGKSAKLLGGNDWVDKVTGW